MPLEPVTAAILAEVAKLDGPKFHQMPVSEGRAFYRESTPDVPEVEVQRVENRSITGSNGEIPIRIYWPKEEASAVSKGAANETRPPLHLQFHGGGWVIGDLETHDASCREICAGAGCIVVAVDYRLAPEHPFPAGLDDCYAAVFWASENLTEIGARSGAISVGGDSAGGSLAAAVAIMARDRKGPEINFQLLLYPVTDPAMNTLSYSENAEGYLLTRDLMKWFWDHYCPDPAQRNDPLANLMLAPDLTGLPPALVMTAEFDPLRDEGEAYADRLKSAGVPMECRRFDGLVHGFFSQAGYIEATRESVDLAVTALRKAHELDAAD